MPRQSNLERVRARCERARKELEAAQARELELLFADHLAKTPHAQEFDRRAKLLRQKIHLLRINVSRKQFSIRSHEAKLTKLKAVVGKLLAEESQAVTELERLEQCQRSDREQFFAQMQANACTRT